MGTGYSYITSGLEELLKVGFGVSGALPFTEMAIGTGTNTPSKTDTGLQAEVFRAPFVLTRDGVNATCALTVPKGTVTTDTPITEFIIVNAHTGGVPLCREVRNAVTLGANTGAIFEMKPFLIARQVA